MQLFNQKYQYTEFYIAICQCNQNNELVVFFETQISISNIEISIFKKKFWMSFPRFANRGKKTELPHQQGWAKSV